MRQRAVDDDVIDTLALAFRRKNLGIKHETPEECVHGLLQISLGMALGLDGIGIRYRDLEAGTAGQDKKARHARGNTRGAEIFCYSGDYRCDENH
jgi:hypothetical protein